MLFSFRRLSHENSRFSLSKSRGPPLHLGSVARTKGSESLASIDTDTISYVEQILPEILWTNKFHFIVGIHFGVYQWIEEVREEWKLEIAYYFNAFFILIFHDIFAKSSVVSIVTLFSLIFLIESQIVMIPTSLLE